MPAYVVYYGFYYVWLRKAQLPDHGDECPAQIVNYPRRHRLPDASLPARHRDVLVQLHLRLPPAGETHVASPAEHRRPRVWVARVGLGGQLGPRLRAQIDQVRPAILGPLRRQVEERQSLAVLHYL